jgi:hypothetical protein
MSKLFVYGIFLDKHTRDAYGMGEHVKYTTVLDYATFGHGIVVAHKLPTGYGYSLTGLLVDIPEGFDWVRLDALEGGYERITVTTTDRDKAYMYAGRDYEG